MCGTFRLGACSLSGGGGPPPPHYPPHLQPRWEWVTDQRRHRRGRNWPPGGWGRGRTLLSGAAYDGQTAVSARTDGSAPPRCADGWLSPADVGPEGAEGAVRPGLGSRCRQSGKARLRRRSWSVRGVEPQVQRPWGRSDRRVAGAGRVRAAEEAQASSCWEAVLCDRGRVGSPRPHPRQPCLQRALRGLGPRLPTEHEALGLSPVPASGEGAGQCPC